MKRSPFAVVALVVAATAAIACSDGSTSQPQPSILAGLARTSSNDTVPNGGPVASGPGFFQGTVLGPSQPGAGNDSLKTAPRIANVVVTIYPKLASTGSEVQTGPAAGSVTTGSDGLFKLPVLPAGDYVVTFVPPANSGYNGVYAFGPLNANSSLYKWWVVLSKK